MDLIGSRDDSNRRPTDSFTVSTPATPLDETSVGGTGIARI
jgi:hypothetical protein